MHRKYINFRLGRAGVRCAIRMGAAVVGRARSSPKAGLERLSVPGWKWSGSGDRRADGFDLVMVFGDALVRTWDQITSFDSSRQRDSFKAPLIETTSQAENVEEETNGPTDFSDLIEAEGDRLIRDDRGVRLAREIND